MLSEGRGWGDSILTRCARVIANFQAGWQGLGILLQDYATPTLKIENLQGILASSQPGDMSLAKRAAAVELTRSLARVVIIGKNEEYKREAVPLTGMADALDKLALRLAASLDMPMSLLMGESPAGLNATGDAELRWFFNQVAALQKRDLLPVLRPIIKLLFLDKVNGPGKEPKNWNIKFHPLWALTAKEQADLRKTVAETDQIYINTGVFDAKIVAENRFGGDEYSVETQIEMDDWEKMAAEADAEQAKADQQAHEQQLAQIAAKGKTK
jgi:phage-related protein (TIGR01555 family)